MSQRQTKRTSQKATLVAVWIPTDLLAQLDHEAKQQDSDRSKIVRQAIRKAVAR